jgi:predicted HD superfamily hydrolase involved in NAD metabolism
MYTEKELESLREAVKSRLSEKRFLHTLGVEKMAAQLASFCLPAKKQSLRAAALLHDIAKELTQGEMLDLIRKGRIALTDEDIAAEATLHSFAAPALIRRDFPRFAEKDILLACKNHTVGSPRMSIFEEIIFISDYIEEGRKYEDSVKLREYVLSSLSNNRKKNVKLLHFAILSSLNSTIAHLEKNKKYINPKTVLTKTAFLSKI